MVTSAELEELLIKHSNQIDKEHIDLFLSLINELRICNISKISNPFLCINMSYICIIVKILIHNLSTFVDDKHSIHNIC